MNKEVKLYFDWKVLLQEHKGSFMRSIKMIKAHYSDYFPRFPKISLPVIVIYYFALCLRFKSDFFFKFQGGMPRRDIPGGYADNRLPR